MAWRQIAIPDAVIFRLLGEAPALDAPGATPATRENVDRLWAIEELYGRASDYQRWVRGPSILAGIERALGRADEALLAVGGIHLDPRSTELLLHCENELLKAIDRALRHLAEPTINARLGLAKAKRKYDYVRQAATGMKAAGWDRATAHARLIERYPPPDGPTARTITKILDNAGFRSRARGKRA